MKLSIIIPVYNVEKYIARCLDSLLDQDLNIEDYEIIVVNDGSKDDSLKIALSYAECYSNINVIDKENGGVGSARNKGIDNAKGTFIYFIDPDDYLVPNCLKKIVDTGEHNNLDVLTFLSTSFFPLDSKGKSISKKNSFEVCFGDKELSPIVSGEEYVANVKYNSSVWWFFINREFLINSNIRFIEGRWMEDAIFTIELLLEAKRIAHLNLNAHRYMVAPGTAMTSKEPSHYIKIIRDNENAALAFDSIIRKLEFKNANPDCINRVKARQQSFVFFSMIRMIKSTISFDEVKLIMQEMTEIKAYPLSSFLGEDYNETSYHVLTRLFNNKRRFFFIFSVLNPLFRIKNKF